MEATQAIVQPPLVHPMFQGHVVMMHSTIGQGSQVSCCYPKHQPIDCSMQSAKAVLKHTNQFINDQYIMDRGRRHQTMYYEAKIEPVTPAIQAMIFGRANCMGYKHGCAAPRHLCISFGYSQYRCVFANLDMECGLGSFGKQFITRANLSIGIDISDL